MTTAVSDTLTSLIRENRQGVTTYSELMRRLRGGAVRLRSLANLSHGDSFDDCQKYIGLAVTWERRIRKMHRQCRRDGGRNIGRECISQILQLASKELDKFNIKD